MGTIGPNSKQDGKKKSVLARGNHQGTAPEKKMCFNILGTARGPVAPERSEQGITLGEEI